MRLLPKLFYGWVIVGAAFMSPLLSYGVVTVAFGILFPFMASALDVSRGLLATTGVTTRLAAAVLAPLIGPIVDRRGPRLMMAVGVVSLGPAPPRSRSPTTSAMCSWATGS